MALRPLDDDLYRVDHPRLFFFIIGSSTTRGGTFPRPS
jgi:hypothetical protein